LKELTIYKERNKKWIEKLDQEIERNAQEVSDLKGVIEKLEHENQQ